MIYRSWDDLANFGNTELLKTEIRFVSVDNGQFYFEGKFRGEEVTIISSECNTTDYSFYAVDTIFQITQMEYVHLMLGGKFLCVFE